MKFAHGRLQVMRVLSALSLVMTVCALCPVALVLGTSTVRSDPTVTITQLTSDLSYWSGGSSISNDGSEIAFQSKADLTGNNADHSYEIFVINSDGTGLRQLTAAPGGPSTSAWSQSPCISGDGSKVAFHSYANLTGGNPDQSAEIFVINWDGTGLRQLTTASYDTLFPEISDDGARVVFASRADLTGGNPGHGVECFIVNSDGTGLRQLTSIASASTFDSYPMISGDGSKVAFHSNTDPLGSNPDHSREVFIMNSDGTGLAQLTNSPLEPFASQLFAVSADGGKVAFWSWADLTGGNPTHSAEVFAVNSDGGGLIQLTHGAQFAQFQYAGAMNADGSWVAFNSDGDLTGDNPDHSMELFVVRADGTGLTQLTNSRTYDSVASSMSADGALLTFVSFADLTGGNPDHSLEVFLATWVPSGNRTIQVGDGRAAPGEVGTVPVSLDNASGVAGMQFDVTYNLGRPGLLSLADVRRGAALPGDWVVQYSTPATDVVRVVAYSPSAAPLPAGSSGVVVELDFTVDGGASVHESCILHRHGIILADEMGLPIEPVAGADGTFTVIPPVHHFAVQVSPAPPEPQGGDLTDPLPFTVHVEARDDSDALVTSYDEAAALSSSVGTPSVTSLSFSGGVWEGMVTIAADLDPDCTLTVQDASLPGPPTGTSPVFALRGKGDVDASGSVNVLDVIRTVNLALLKPVPAFPRYAFQFWAGDMNRDHSVNVLDVIQIVNKSLGRSPAPPAGASALRAAAPSAVPVTVSLVKGKSAWEVRVSNAAGMAGAQLEIAEAEWKVSVGDLIARAGWQVRTSPVGEGLRVIAYSSSAAGLAAGNGTLLRLTNVKGKPRLMSVLLSDPVGKRMATR